MKQIANRKSQIATSLQATLIVALALISTISLMAQNGNTFPSTGNAGVGTNNPSEKFEVVGNTKVKGDFTVTDTTKLKGDIKFISLKDLNINDDRFIGINKHGKVKTYTNILLNTPNGVLDVTGNIYSSGTLTANSLNITGVTAFTNNLQVTRITALPGDSLIRFGDSTITIHTSSNRITWSQTCLVNVGTQNNPNYVTLPCRGLSIGNGSTFALGPNSMALGYNVATISTAAINSIVIGSGVSSTQRLTNALPNSLSVGFNSDLPTFFVGPANGQGTTGNVGIGTTNPQGKLQIGDGISKIAMGDAYTGNPLFLSNYIGFNVGRTNGLWTANGDGGSNGGFVMIGDVAGGVRFCNIKSTGGASQQVSDQTIFNNSLFVIKADGAVGIGTITPNSAYKLSVNGDMRVKRIVVETGWSDFVFKPDYKLMSFNELEDYILQNGHLPNIPSEKEIIENGADVGEILKLHMQKIEELTLYILQLQKEIEVLKKK